MGRKWQFLSLANKVDSSSNLSLIAATDLEYTPSYKGTRGEYHRGSPPQQRAKNPSRDQGRKDIEKMKTMMKKMMVAVLIVSLVFSQLESAQADAFDCYDACTTGCVQPDTRLMARCERKCGIRCGNNNVQNSKLEGGSS
ncbi:hypothetical protein Tsubulata_018021 [Turnera subulata]|uniref:Thionin-like protein n=1 Tax=Turnera subulata TaxID=218843 RepID=A0A9Q0JLQ1_9ROSI|nr:hypothetical protein Tsubulata_018021 [Turnera subulata]